MADSLIEYILGLRDEMSPKIDDATSHVKKMEVALGGVRTMALEVGAALGIGFAVFKGVEFIKESNEQWEQMEFAISQIEAGLKSTGQAAGLTFEDIKKSASELSHDLKFTQSSVLDMQSILLTFPSVTKDIFTDASAAALDMATRLKTDASSAALQLGKALQDPVAGLGALHRVGVNVDELKKKFETVTDTLGRQKLILAELTAEFGGSASAAAEADVSFRYNKTVEELRVEVGYYADKISEALMPAVLSMIEVVKDIVESLIDFGKWIVQNKELLTDLAIVIGTSTIAYYSYLAVSQASVLWSGIKAAASAIEMAALMGVGVAMEFVNAVFLASPIGWIVLGVAALTAGVLALIRHFGSFGNAMKDTWEIIKAFGVGVGGVFKGIGETITGALTLNPKMIAQGLTDTINAAKDAGKQISEIWNNKDAQDAAAARKSLLSPKKEDPLKKTATTITSAPTPKTKAEGQKNINIHIAINGGLVHEMKIMTTTINESAGKIKDQVAAALVGAINQSQIIGEH